MNLFNRYLKDYCFTIRESIAQRNFLSQEYYSNKLALNDKKTKFLQSGEKPEIDTHLLKLNDFTVEQVMSNEEIKKRFLYSNVS